jgi:hypothetical protein
MLRPKIYRGSRFMKKHFKKKLFGIDRKIARDLY